MSACPTLPASLPRTPPPWRKAVVSRCLKFVPCLIRQSIIQSRTLQDSKTCVFFLHFDLKLSEVPCATGAASVAHVKETTAARGKKTPLTPPPPIALLQKQHCSGKNFANVPPTLGIKSYPAGWRDSAAASYPLDEGRLEERGVERGILNIEALDDLP